mmetsp:Transcript_5928/g.8727  ORF Transcript_5928/g.8727 Transcript_5928/m.8727 type:complete len:142 (-) Transcript_5928:67-492(-)|eukprot:CAMPEP_0116016256 /NCGR_PEP_ID=MMETSP0321-20121206/7358_1 /TAXON_ID=163516 /ORGANISM="Leptocylindrus danicus var. danicus, Strain B650" /LENGTH=141 /DNA_ID=CAMNT_0003486251 /DNA_START=7 /DNA_END=432 /DNA_ORIENTATION=-
MSDAANEPAKEHNNNNDDDDDGGVRWTAITISWSISVFLLAGVAEIMGGWLIWVAVRGNNGDKKPWYFAVIGSLVLIAYGFIPCLQPMDEFGRIYAVYGGFFIVLSFLFGWMLDGNRPDLGDMIGCLISLAGVLVIMFWPR